MQRIKVTYSILSKWEQGQYDDAIKYLFKLPTIKTPQMLEGQMYHEQWDQEIQKTKCLPAIFGGAKLNNPKPEQYLKVNISDWLVLSGKIDCYDNPVTYEWKTGKQTSEDVIRSKQPGVYGVLLTMSGLYTDMCEIHCYNQHLKKDNISMSREHITDNLLKDSLNWIETLAGEILNFCQQNDLFSKYTQKI